MAAPESDDLSKETPAGIRWKPAIWIIGVIAGLLVLFRVATTVADDTTFLGTATTLCLMLGLLSLLVWWLVFSRAPWKLRLGGVAGVAALASMFQIQGFSGGFLPTVVFRWKKPVEAERPAATASGASAGEVSLATGYMPTGTDWTEFRGASRDGIVRGATFSAGWLDPELQWRIPVGEGWSSFCVVGPLAFTQWQDGESEVTVCLEAANGREIWRHADGVRFEETMGGPGPRATPTYSNGRLFALGATGILNCLDPNDGTLRWSVNILADNNAGNIQWAMSGSPLVDGGRVIVAPGGAANASLVAYDIETGEKSWHVGDAAASYSSPLLAAVCGERQLLIFDGDGVSAYNPGDGRPLWNHSFTTSMKINVAQPGVVGGSAMLLSLGYGVGSLMIDVERKDEAWTATERWKSKKLKSKFNDFVIRDGHAYGLDEGMLACMRLSDGSRAWKGMRCGYGQLLLVGDVLVVLSEKGEVVYVKADPADEAILGRFKAISGKTWNHPVIANGRLFVRNTSEAACFALE